MKLIRGITQQKFMKVIIPIDEECCGGGDLGSVVTTDSDTVLFTGDGTLASPLSANINIVTTDGASISFTGNGTTASPLSAEFTGTIPPDTNIYNTSGTIIASQQRIVSGDYGSSLNFSWKDSVGTADSYLIGVNSGGGGGRVRLLAPTGSVILTQQNFRLNSAGVPNSTQTYLEIDMTGYNFTFGANPTIVFIKNDGLYLPTTPNLKVLATDAGGKVVAFTPMAAIANLAAAPTQADFNNLLAELRTAGLLTP